MKKEEQEIKKQEKEDQMEELSDAMQKSQDEIDRLNYEAQMVNKSKEDLEANNAILDAQEAEIQRQIKAAAEEAERKAKEEADRKATITAAAAVQAELLQKLRSMSIQARELPASHGLYRDITTCQAATERAGADFMQESIYPAAEYPGCMDAARHVGVHGQMRASCDRKMR